MFLFIVTWKTFNVRKDRGYFNEQQKEKSIK